MDEDDRYLRGGGLRRAHRLVLERHDEIDPTPHEVLGCLSRRALIGQISPDQTDVPALERGRDSRDRRSRDVMAKSSQALSEAVEGRRNVIETHVKETDPVHLPRLLRRGGERRDEDAERNAPQERPPRDHSIT